MGNRAHKCKTCRQAFRPTKIDQKYCSHKCRQAAYRRRKTLISHRPTLRPSKPLEAAVCTHCGGKFWAKTKRSVFCSTSCRTLHHRALKASIPQALMFLFQLPKERAYDVMETQSMGKLRSLLTSAGYVYVHRKRGWVKAAY